MAATVSLAATDSDIESCSSKWTIAGMGDIAVGEGRRVGHVRIVNPTQSPRLERDLGGGSCGPGEAAPTKSPRRWSEQSARATGLNKLCHLFCGRPYLASTVELAHPPRPCNTPWPRLSHFPSRRIPKPLPEEDPHRFDWSVTNCPPSYRTLFIQIPAFLVSQNSQVTCIISSNGRFKTARGHVQ